MNTLDKFTARVAYALPFAALLFSFFALAASAGESGPPGNGGVQIVFSDNGAGGTAVNASGTGITDDDDPFEDASLGFGDMGNGDTFDPISGALINLGPLAEISLTDPLAFSWMGLGTTYIYDSFVIDFFGAENIGFLTSVGSGPNIPGTSATMSVVDGVGVIPIPFSTFAAVYGQSFASTDGFTFIFLNPNSSNPNNPGGGGNNQEPETILVTNVGAIMSSETTGIGSMDSTLSGVENAVQNATGDLNNRIFRARSGGTGGGDFDEDGEVDGQDFQIWQQNQSSNHDSTYLKFAASQNIDYRVALGLADGKVVEMVDTLSGGHPFAMAGGTAVVTKAVVASVDGEKNPIADKIVVAEPEPYTRWTAYTAFDYGFYDQDDLTRVFRGFESDSYAGSAGLEYKVLDWLNVGGAFTYLNQDTNLNANLGSNDVDGEVYSIYTTAFHGNTYLDVLYSYGDLENEISRNTLLGRTAFGDTESHAHNFEVNVGHTINVNNTFSFGPFASYTYTEGQVDGYTERNGGLAGLVYPDHEFDSSIGRLGTYATFKNPTSLGQLTTVLSAAWAHEFDPDNGNITASLQNSPFVLVTGNRARSIGGYTAERERAHAGTDWLELGVTSRLNIKDSGLHLELGYQGMFGRNNASGHFGSAKLGLEW